MSMKKTGAAAVALVGGMALSGLVAAPRASAAGHITRAAAPAPTATATPKAALTLTANTTNRGGVITVSGAGFMPGETINLTLSGATGTPTTAKADVKGLLPSTGVTVPFSLKPGSYVLSATGATSKRMATAPVTVAALTPSLTVSAPSLTPNAVETVTGKGFAQKEQVTLSLNGEALLTSPTAITTTNGAFTATFTAPSTLLNGANAISALGAQSRVSALASATGVLTSSVQFYFAGAINTQAERSMVNLLNTNSVPASVRLTFYFENGASYTRLTTVAAHSVRSLPVANLGNLPAGRYGLAVSSDRAITAQITTNRDPQDGDVLTGSSGLATHWYLAAGETVGSFQERVSILNPSQVATTVQLQFVSLGYAPKTVTVTAGAHSNRVIDVNSYYPNAGVSIIAIANSPVVVERTVSFSTDQRSYTSRTAARTPSTQWLFTDATTENGVQSVLSILNPGDFGSSVSVSFSGSNGQVLRTVPLFVPARSRGTFTLNGTVSGGGIAVVATSSQAVVIELSEYIGAPAQATAASVVLGRNGAATRWTFAGGDTTAGHDDVLVLYNPSAVTVPISGTFYSTDGKMVTHTYSVAPTGRIVIPVNTLGLTTTNGAVLTSGNGQGFIAEQSVSSRDSHLLAATQGYAQ